MYGEGTQVDDFVGAYLYNNRKEMIIYICIFLFLLFFNCVRLLTSQYFTPLHRNIARDLRAFIKFIFDFIPYFGDNLNNLGKAFGEIGTYIVMFIGDLIFLEIIIFGFFDCNKNTKEKIIKREREIEELNNESNLQILLNEEGKVSVSKNDDSDCLI